MRQTRRAVHTEKTLVLAHLMGKSNPADIGTKPLGKLNFERHSKFLRGETPLDWTKVGASIARSHERDLGF